VCARPPARAYRVVSSVQTPLIKTRAHIYHDVFATVHFFFYVRGQRQNFGTHSNNYGSALFCASLEQGVDSTLCALARSKRRTLCGCARPKSLVPRKPDLGGQIIKKRRWAEGDGCKVRVDGRRRAASVSVRFPRLRFENKHSADRARDSVEAASAINLCEWWPRSR